MATKEKIKKIKINPKQSWVAVHWLTGQIQSIGTEKECRQWAKRNSFNPDAPIYYAFPVQGVQIHIHSGDVPKKKKK